MKRKRIAIVSDVVIGPAIATEIRTESAKETEVSGLVAAGVPGPAVRNPTSMRLIAAKRSPSASGTTANPAWPRLFCQTVSRLDTMIVSTETEKGSVTEEIGIVIGTASVTEETVSVSVTETVSAIAIMTGHFGPAATSR